MSAAMAWVEPPPGDAQVLDAGLRVLLDNAHQPDPAIVEQLVQALGADVARKARALLQVDVPLDRDNISTRDTLALRAAMVRATAVTGLS